MARSKSDSCTTAGRRPASFMRRPASCASFTPRSLSGTSVHPVNRFSRFHVLSPWRRRTSVPGLAVAIHLGRRLDDVRELVGVEARPGAEHLADDLADEAHRFVGVLRVGVAAAADRPHRLVRDDQARGVVGGAAGEPGPHLGGNDLVRLPLVVVVEQLADAHDHAQLGRQRRRGLLGDHLVGLAEVEAPLGVADDHPLAQRLDHGRRDLARVRAGNLPEHVLRAELDAGLDEQVRNRGQPDERGKDRHLDPIRLAARHGHHPAHEVERVVEVVRVHLPVGRDERHPWWAGAHASCRIAMPGSSLPSRYSSVAPPPVETWENLPAMPSASIAATVSPPPTSVKPPVAAIASPTAFVPSAKSLISATPTGPFQITVPAPRSFSRNSVTDLGPMSSAIHSGSTFSASRIRRGCPASIFRAHTTSTGSTSLSPPSPATAFASSSAVSSTRPAPVGHPRALKNVFAIAPPTRSASTFFSRWRSTPTFVETLAPPTTATMGRFGLSSALCSAASSASISSPA